MDVGDGRVDNTGVLLDLYNGVAHLLADYIVGAGFELDFNAGFVDLNIADGNKAVCGGGGVGSCQKGGERNETEVEETHLACLGVYYKIRLKSEIVG